MLLAVQYSPALARFRIPTYNRSVRRALTDPAVCKMSFLDSDTLDLLWHDEDAREVRLREIITDRLRENPPPAMDDFVVATYFLALRTMTLEAAVGEIAYHSTSGTKNPPAGSLLEECTAMAAARKRAASGVTSSTCWLAWMESIFARQLP